MTAGKSANETPLGLPGGAQNRSPEEQLGKARKMHIPRERDNFGRRLTDLLGVLSIAGLIYCVGAYLYLRSVLTPAMTEPSDAIDGIGASAVLILALAGFYHLVLLARAFRMLGTMPSGRFLHSAFLAAVILSGLALATEPVQLSEIGKEYIVFEVEGQWGFLIASTLGHLAVVTAGWFYTRRTAGGISDAVGGVDSRSDAFFATMHQVGILCGGLGILGVLSYNHWGVLERYRPFLIVVLSILALLPWGTILAFLIVRNRRKPPSAWFDEKQTADTAAGALCSMLAVMPLLVVLGAADWYVGLGQPLSFWLMLVFFLCLVIFSGSVLVRSRADGVSGAM